MSRASASRSFPITRRSGQPPRFWTAVCEWLEIMDDAPVLRRTATAAVEWVFQRLRHDAGCPEVANAGRGVRSGTQLRRPGDRRPAAVDPSHEISGELRWQAGYNPVSGAVRRARAIRRPALCADSQVISPHDFHSSPQLRLYQLADPPKPIVFRIDAQRESHRAEPERSEEHT